MLTARCGSLDCNIQTYYLLPSKFLQLHALEFTLGTNHILPWRNQLQNIIRKINTHCIPSPSQQVLSKKKKKKSRKEGKANKVHTWQACPCQVTSLWKCGGALSCWNTKTSGPSPSKKDTRNSSNTNMPRYTILFTASSTKKKGPNTFCLDKTTNMFNSGPSITCSITSRGLVLLQILSLSINTSS